MEREYKINLLRFIILLIIVGINYIGYIYLPNIFLQIVLIVVTSILLVISMSKLQNISKLKKITKYISNVNNLDFNVSEIEGIPLEAKEVILAAYKEIRENLKTQVEISTDVFNVCEELALFTGESLINAEDSSSTVEIANKSILEQDEMLGFTNELANEIYSSMENIEKEVNTKIEFISDSINTAQGSIETIDQIENRINNSKNMVEESSTKILELRNYFDEVVGFVDLINEISSQTQLLSLNASIEAARAGEEGRGFSVVAMEVGKLATQTESVSKKIEEVIENLTIEINHISESMEEETRYMEENTNIAEETNKEFRSIVGALNLGKDSLEEIKDHARENTHLIEDINLNIEKILEFSNETTSQMEVTTDQILEQHKRTIRLDEIANNIRGHVGDMQQFVVGKAMEEKMLSQVDAIYIRDPSGVVQYTNEKSAIGLNLYEADPTFHQFKSGNKEYLVTPIKKRVEDGKLFKFLTVTDDKGSLYEVGLGLHSLIKNI